MAPKVSVIIPIYNAMPYLTQMMDSVCAQTLKDIEIICVDDGSTDNSCKVIDEYCAKDNRVRLIRQEHSNAGAARNNGLQFASGEYLAFLDADDFFELEMLDTALNKAKEDQSDVVVFRSNNYIDSTGEFTSLAYSIERNLLPNKQPFCARDIKKDFFHLFVWWPWDKLFRTDFIRKHQLKYQEQRTTNDLVFVCSAVLLADHISTIDNVFAHHRVLKSGRSLSVSRELSWDNYYYALVKLRAKLKVWNLYDCFEQDFINYCLNFSLWHLYSLKGQAYFNLYDKLKKEWFIDFGISDKKRNYFYIENEFDVYKTIMSIEAEEFLFYLIDNYLEELENRKIRISRYVGELNKKTVQLNKYEEELNEKTVQASRFERELEKGKAEANLLAAELKNTKMRLQSTKRELNSIKKSLSFRVGRIITWPGRKIRDCLKH